MAYWSVEKRALHAQWVERAVVALVAPAASEMSAAGATYLDRLCGRRSVHALLLPQAISYEGGPEYSNLANAAYLPE